MSTNAEVKKKEKEELEIQFAPIEFKSFGKFTRLHNDQLCRIVKGLYSEIFHDLVGVNLNYTNGFNVEFYFENNSEPVEEGKVKNVINLTQIDTTVSGKKPDFFTRQAIVQRKTRGEKFSLNDETKELLADIMFGGKNANNVNSKNWNNNIKEVAVPISGYYDPFGRPNSSRILIQVTGIDLKRLLKKIYGNKMVVSTETTVDSEINNYSKQAYYMPVFHKWLNDGTFAINILQIDAEEVQKLTVKENPAMPQMSGVRFY